MKNQKVLLTILAPCLSLLLANCSASVGGGGDAPSTPQKPSQVFDRPAIAGLDVVGVWQSNCVSDVFTNGTRQATLEFVSKSDFKFTNISYSDSNCKQATKTQSHVGVYQFTDKLSEILYGIDYNYKEQNVTYKMNGQRLELNSGIMYISEFVFGNVDVNRDLPLRKQALATIPGGASSTVANCKNYAGTYQMNSDYFRIEQTNCSKLVWVTIATYDNPIEVRSEYIADGQSHLVGGKPVIAAFNDKGLFTMSLQNNQGDTFLRIYSFQKDPCNLANPSGKDYLTKDVFIGGVEQPSSCFYWAKR